MIYVYALISYWAISCVNVELQTKVSKMSVSIIRVHLLNTDPADRPKKLFAHLFDLKASIYNTFVALIFR
jgi:hypothetical protein